MKKSLSILLSIAMAFSIFASVAMGAEANLDVNAKYNALVEAGIFTGDGDDQAANLDHTMTRAQFATVLVRTFNLPEDVAASNVYTDLDGAGWAAGYIGAVTKAGLMNGRSATGFAPSEPVKIEELATVLVRAFDLQESTSGVTGTVDDWARGYVGAALQAGLIGAKADYTVDALRADLVESAYVVYQIILGLQTPEVAFKVSGAKQFTVDFNKAVDADKVTFEVKLGTATVATSKVTWSDDRKSAVLEFASNLQYGDYTVTVKGASANDVSGNLTIEAERIAGIEILSDTAPAVMNSTNYGIIESVNVYYKVTNQYGQDITRTSSVNWSSSISGSQGINDDIQNGKLTITIPALGTEENPQPNFYYRVGTEFSLNGFITGSNVTVQKSLKIGDEARATTIEPLELYSTSDKPLSVNSDYLNYYILLNIKDQYGNPIKADKLTGQAGQLNVFSSNPLLVDVNSQNPVFVDNAGPNSNQLGLQLQKNEHSTNMNLGGTAVISFSPKYGGGQTVTFSIEVKKTSEVQNISLSVPTTTVSANEKVTIPFVATDQDGNTITDPDLLNNNTVNLTRTGGSVAWITKDGKAQIEFTAPNYIGNVTINAFVLATGKTSQVNVNVRDAKYPTTINQLSVTDAFLEGVGITIKGSNISVYDQYSGSMTEANFFAKYAYRVNVVGIGSVVTAGGATVADNTYLLKTKDDNIVINGSQKGNVSIKVDVVNHDGSEIKETIGFTERNFTKGSVKEFSLRVVNWNDIASFEVADIAKVFNTHGTTFKENKPAVNVTGKTSGGLKVNIGKVAQGNYNIVTSTQGLKVDGDTVTSSDQVAQFGGTDIETKGLVVVNIFKPEDPRTIQKEVVISKATPVVTTVTLAEIKRTVAEVEGKTVLESLLSKLELKDQYGTVQASFKDNISLTAFEISKNATIKVDGNALTAGTLKKDAVITGAKAGDTFTITLLAGGHYVTQKVTITE